MYETIAGMGLDMLHENKTMVYTKYKNVDKKVKPATRPLRVNSDRKRKEDPSLRKSLDIRYTIT